ncbi:MAG: MaoC family dehydratase [Acidisphaera sp.]|nr:MaoC family dehydratase [Acidisphaera sp.]MBV9813091.1 MaoC family dehydratase [Acetobacteraceae bacterium]
MRHTLVTRWFDDFHVSERFALPTRTVTAELIRAFAEATGDAQPLRSSPEDHRALGYDCALAHAFLATMQTVACFGAFPFLLDDSLVSVLDQSSRCLRPVLEGDILSPVLQVVELEPGRGTGIVTLRSTVHNQAKALVLVGAQRWLMRGRPPITAFPSVDTAGR